MEKNVLNLTVDTPQKGLMEQIREDNNRKSTENDALIRMQRQEPQPYIFYCGAEVAEKLRTLLNL